MLPYQCSTPAPLQKSMPSHPAKLDFLAVGDTMLDVFVQIHEAAVACSLDHTACRISFDFGAKIPVEGVVKLPGAGNASNAAIAAARLGLSTGICATIGDDLEAGQIVSRWKQEHVRTTYVHQARHQATNYSTVLTFRGERTILVYHQHCTYILPKNMPTIGRIYYTSLGQNHEAFESALLGYLSSSPKTRVTFQPGTFQLRRTVRGTQDILKRTDILVMNKEEVALFLENSVEEPMRDQLKRLQALGPRICVVTDGENGSYAIEGKKAWVCERFPVPCVERTGAGDAYTSAFTWAIDKGFSVPDAMRYGTANAASVIQFLGPHEGLLRREGLNQLLRKFINIRPKPLHV